MLTTLTTLGTNRCTPRLWLESARLNTLGFTPGTPLTISHNGTTGLRIQPTSEARSRAVALAKAENHVSSRHIGGITRPIIDINSSALLSTLAQYHHTKIRATVNQLLLTPSARSFAIHKHTGARLTPPYKVLELFSGGGTLSAALHNNPDYQLIAGAELEPDYADVWSAAHPGAHLFQTDLRHLHPAELPRHHILLAGIPCTSHSNLGRAKKKLAGAPELGDTGDLFIPVLNTISHHMPAAVVIENVPNYADSLAGQLLKTTLKHLGYHVADTILQPCQDWAEPTDRKRWLCIATLHKPLTLHNPHRPHTKQLKEYLDPPNPAQDQADAQRIAKTIQGLDAHNARHAAMGHGFGYTTITGEETTCPTIIKSYHKINNGPFVQTPYGPRMLRKQEIERIMGSTVQTPSYAIACQILGQGVQTRIFHQILLQLSHHLNNNQNQ